MIMKMTAARKGIIAVEKKAQDLSGSYVKSSNGDVSFRTLKTMYPQGAEKVLIYSLTGKKVPYRGLPVDAGFIVVNAQTAVAVFNAVAEGIPCVERVLTAAVDSAKTANLRVKTGTPVSEAARHLALDVNKVQKIVSGGPMMGTCLVSADLPVSKTTSGLLFYNEAPRAPYEYPCVSCGKCVSVCPVLLLPNMLVKKARVRDLDGFAGVYPDNCMECGCCSYVCPSAIPLVHYIRLGKNLLRSKGK